MVQTGVYIGFSFGQKKIKKPLIKAITTFENRDIDYFKCAMMAEFYRIILFGLSKTTKVEGLKSRTYS